MSKVDVIIPVYNNIQVTLTCIKSLYENLSQHINKIIIHDDCSDNETKTILKSLNDNVKSNYLDIKGDINNLQVIRSEPNIGFAAGVNKACAHATADYLFILNSDTNILDDILTPMLQILSLNPHIAAINPSGPVYKSKQIKRCAANYIQTKLSTLPYIYSTNLSGYALLISRKLFHEVNGFNPIYGRGYYEDTELSRVLLNHGYKLAIYPTEKITHIGQASFKQVNKSKNLAKELMHHNQKLYYSRFPHANQQVDIYTLKSDFNKLLESTREEMISLVQAGATVTWHGLFQPKNFPYFQIKFKRLRLKDLKILITSSS